MSLMKYDLGHGQEKNWIVSENDFNSLFLGKGESIMCLGNGYLGLRSATEEKYVGETRDMLIAGTFNKFDGEVTELPNAADLTEITIFINGERFSLLQGEIKNYSRNLNLKTGELNRNFIWSNKDFGKIKFEFKRFVSLKNLHLIGQKVSITPLEKNIEVKIQSGINGQVSNTGAQHFTEGEKRVYDSKYIQYTQRTTESNIDFVSNTVHKFEINKEEVSPSSLIVMDRRKVYYNYDLSVKENETLVIEKISNVFTSRDKECEKLSYEELKEFSLENIKKEYTIGYEELQSESAKAWEDKIWSKCSIKIDSQNDYEQLAIRFAQYHLVVMTPAHDNRMNIGAKGLSGEGYKGHTFWDTEIFMLPYFIYTDPKVAKSLLEYRYLTLAGARKKAKENGYEGAQFPWESAWLEDGEVTPEWGSADVITGKAEKIWTGFIEIHVTSDVVYGTWHYYKASNDQEFMDNCGYEIIFDCATFWQSRLEWNEEKQIFEIIGVIGPDEYKEHIDNNAFTNYTAKWNLELAMNYYNELKENRPDLFNKLNEKLNLDENFTKWASKINKIYLPKPNEDNIIPQDDTYLSKEIIDLTKYKNQTNIGSFFKDYNMKQANEIQVSKQADIMVMFLLLEGLFSEEVKRANWDYYEPKTLHDSSLSLSTHCTLANDLGYNELSYDLFRKACDIDLGPNMKTSDAGIHAASLGGVWQCVVNGFGGVRMIDGKLRINPTLPNTWNKLEFPLHWHGDLLKINVSQDELLIENTTKNNEEIVFTHRGNEYKLYDNISIKLG
ncbi:glycoside hydrolase family 65 protein [[Clostridium] dakarense]|uniref:glycoside hydrolase family 65 protein n=1 Tax=Faecalimicrobium dakarense TaxID=1301100 RepID=UPI0004AC9933|nr:glycosyl hydrolase family 65 protein [[Clostridium] dakarense]